ncbi:hypothetical protein KAR91_14335 [Candidatus Pacearchaeota archaeon]|nr:hypothetical protein [Candidatus Pacearchaeota archaeon]
MNKLTDEEQVDGFWEQLHDFYGIEGREEIEKQANNWHPKNPLLVVLHYIWKREPKVKQLEEEIEILKRDNEKLKRVIECKDPKCIHYHESGCLSDVCIKERG